MERRKSSWWPSSSTEVPSQQGQELRGSVSDLASAAVGCLRARVLDELRVLWRGGETGGDGSECLEGGENWKI